MNDGNHVEQRLRGLTPRGTEPEMRGQVLAAVGRELAAGRVPRWRRRPGLAVAASLFLAVAMNVWINTTVDRRMARLYGPPPVPRRIVDVAEAVASVTDAETGRRFERQLAAAWRSHVARLPRRPTMDYSQLLRELELSRKETRHEDSQSDRGAAGHSSGCQWDLGLDDRFAA